MSNKRFVALDVDGIIIVELQYLSDPADVELISGAAAGLRQLSEMGLGLVAITNQSGVGRGYFDEERVHQIHQRISGLLEAEGVRLDGIYFCPHTPEDGCHCRKPKPGLLELAGKELDFDPGACFVIGDKACDIELGQRLGRTTFLVRTGYGAELANEGTVAPDHIVDGLREAAKVIQRLLESDKRNKAVEA